MGKDNQGHARNCNCGPCVLDRRRQIAADREAVKARKAAGEARRRAEAAEQEQRMRRTDLLTYQPFSGLSCSK